MDQSPASQNVPNSANNTPAQPKKWFRTNLFFGAVFVIAGLAISWGAILFGISQGSDSRPPSPAIISTVNGFELVGGLLIQSGIFFFWIIRPAFQKWWKTDNRWLFWVILAATLLLFCVLWGLFNS